MKVALLLFGAALAGCSEAPPDRATAGEPDEAGAWFEECALERGLRFEHRAFAERRFDFPEIMGGGAGLFDADADGDLDLFLVDSGDLRAPRGAQGTSRFFENQGAGRFVDATERAGFSSHDYGMGVACGDYDNDGDADVFLTAVGRTTLYRNDGARFSDVTLAARAGVEGWSASAGFSDWDGDGWLDLFVVRYLDWSPERELDCRAGDDQRDYCAPLRYGAPSTCVLLRNRGDGSFEERGGTSGPSTARGNGLGLAFAALGADRRQAAIVANDMTPNHVWLAEGAGLVEVAARRGLALNSVGLAASGMGIQATDYDDDGDLDVFVTHLRRQGNALYVQDSAGTFRDQAARAGLFRPSLAFTGFGCAFADFDCDGDLDLYVANGRVAREPPIADPREPYAEADQLFEQRVGARFVEVLPRGGVRREAHGSSRAAALGDVDDDGGLDLVVVEQGARVRLLRNRVRARGAWVGFRVVDEHGRDALGARVELVQGGRARWRTVDPVHGYLSSNDPRVHFGLGERAGFDALFVHWPDGTRQEFSVRQAGAYHDLSRRQPVAPRAGNGK